MALYFTAYATKNGAYKANKKMPAGSPAGIIVHSTGANNPNLKRYVNCPSICGKNIYKNYFDSASLEVCPHGVIGKDKNGNVKAAKILPWNICCWGCGNGKKGSYNYSPAYIQIEICEDGLNDKKYFDDAFTLMAKVCNYLMRVYPTIKLDNIISHKEACARGYASNHGDCDHWLVKFGKDMDWFIDLVKNNGEIVENYIVEATKTVNSSNEANSLKSKLTNLGFEVKIKEGN